MSIRDTEEYERGLAAERTLVRWFQAEGWFVFHFARREEFKIEGAGGSLILPDLLMMRDGELLLCEVKRKSVATWYRNGTQWEFGLEAHHLESYRAIAEHSGAPVGIYVWHDCIPDEKTPRGVRLPAEGIYYCDALELVPRKNGSMYYCPLAQWVRIAGVDDVERIER